MNWNYSSAEFEENLYDEVGDWSSEQGGEKGSTPGQKMKGQILERVEGERRTNVQRGIKESTEYDLQRYEDVPEVPVVPIPQGFIGRDDEAVDGEQEKSCKDQEQVEFEEGIQVGYKNSTTVVEHDETEREELDSFGDCVRTAIAYVDATHRQGEERLQLVLETLEDGIEGAKTEGGEIMERLQELVKDSPRRSARLEAKRMTRAKGRKN